MIASYDLGWAAGFIEGEGCVYYSGTPTVTAGQVDQEPLERLRRLFGGSIHLQARAGRGLAKQDLFVWRITGERAAGVMMTLWALISQRKRTRIAQSLARWRAKSRCRNRDYWRTGDTKCTT